ncbi:MAG: 2,3-dihydroxyphenylpropionate 1,2-dioxygenase [Rhodospirillaceae bacterium]|jgi:aromatic ring-opening dioxygenase catalytic subunit (LigB family)|nr:2,3-dihydroxyphenylpropionate 1,2-dioxygenase [Rhodospirillaceae bacterium]
MAELVGAFAASHAPLIAREWERMSPDARETIKTSFDEMGRRLAALKPDVLVMLSPDHWVNFFLNNLPSFCVGVGSEHDGPPEPFLAPVFPHETLPGHAGFGRHLVDTAFAQGFDPSISHRVRLDHGFCIPLWRLGLDPLPAIVPVFVNELEDPMPRLARCFDWGRLIASAVQSYPEDLRVAIVGSGGLSHSIGEPTMGDIDEPFDAACIDLFTRADESEITAKLEDLLPHTGNGSEEVRSWIIAHAAMGGQGFDLIHYAPIPEVYVGCGFAEWTRAT